MKKNTKKDELNPEQEKTDAEKTNISLQEQLKEIIRIPDKDYSDKILTSSMRAYIQGIEKEYIASL